MITSFHGQPINPIVVHSTNNDNNQNVPQLSVSDQNQNQQLHSTPVSQPNPSNVVVEKQQPTKKKRKRGKEELDEDDDDEDAINTNSNANNNNNDPDTSDDDIILQPPTQLVNSRIKSSNNNNNQIPRIDRMKTVLKHFRYDFKKWSKTKYENPTARSKALRTILVHTSDRIQLYDLELPTFLVDIPYTITHINHYNLPVLQDQLLRINQFSTNPPRTNNNNNRNERQDLNQQQQSYGNLQQRIKTNKRNQRHQQELQRNRRVDNGPFLPLNHPFDITSVNQADNEDDNDYQNIIDGQDNFGIQHPLNPPIRILPPQSIQNNNNNNNNPSNNNNNPSPNPNNAFLNSNVNPSDLPKV